MQNGQRCYQTQTLQERERLLPGKTHLLFEENIKQLSKFDNNSYRLWVEKMRQNGNLRLDDTTIVELEIK